MALMRASTSTKSGVRSSTSNGRAVAVVAVSARPATARRSRAALVVSAAANQPDGAIAVANSIGLPTDEGLFGFTPFAERWTGRLAMAGFTTSIIEEFLTGQGTLAQVGIPAGGTTLAVLLALLGGATLVGTGATAAKLASKKMTPREMARYRQFLGLNNANDFMAEAARMKQQGDFTSLRTDAAAIGAARAAGLPADRVLGVAGAVEEAEGAAAAMKAADGSVLTLTKAEEAAQVAAAAAEAKQQQQAVAAAGPSVSLAARSDIVEQDAFSALDASYAAQVELSQGRWAMLGFVAAILGEAATGHGVLMQLIDWFKLSGLLGQASGF